MMELNYAFISENGKEVDKTLDWSYIDWHEKKTVRGTDAQTQTQYVQSEDKDTQTASPFIMRIDLGRMSSRQRYGSLTESDSIPPHLFQFDRQAPARISTSPTLRRMRSMRISYRDPSKSDSSLGEESPTPTSPLSPLFRQKSPLAVQSDGENGNFESSVIHGTIRSHRSKTLDNGVICKSKESHDSKEPVSDDNESTTDDNDQASDPCHKRLQERRRSSVVVSLPGLDVSPGDLFVSNGVADILNKSAYSDTKKSKWPFSRRNTQTKGKGSVADIDKCLAGIQIQEWRDTDFQTYKDMSLEDFLRDHSELGAAEDPKAYRKQEAIWELFTSECVYFLDHLMVLKEVFLTTLTDLQMRECLQDIDSWRLFANLNELCLAFGDSICHCLQKYCLNYSTAILYLDSLKLREDFGSFVKWCERNEQCRRLQLKDLLVVPLQRFTRYPLLLKNIGKKSCLEAEENTIQTIVDLVDRAIYDLEGKVKWLDNYQKVKQLKEALVWLPVWEQDKRAHVPENLKHLLKAVTLENLVSHRSLLHDGKLVLIENAKMHEVYLFLFDEFLLITKIKRSKKRSGVVELNPLRSVAGQELDLLLQESCSFIVLDQPISLDRLQLKNIDQLNATASGLPNSFIIMHQNRYQQCIGVFILQAQTESVKKAWVTEIEDATNSLLKQDCQQPRVNNSFLESSQI
ncbi:hypothetical protein cypCar_00012058 [Cyprinus carpio]|nr:hypothetical protein cypCar_00012058 [Cyprinus carpio]